MINKNRYYRYLYYAFPFDVKNAKRLCPMNGDVAEYAKDVTGHGTDVYTVNAFLCYTIYLFIHLRKGKSVGIAAKVYCFR